MASLYRSSKAKHPAAREVPTSRDLSLNLPTTISESIPGLTAAGTFVVLGFGILVFGLIDTLIFGSTTLLTSIVFVVLSIFVASRTSVKSPWAAWTSPVISLFFMLLITTPFSDNQFGGTFSTILIGTLLGLSDRTWLVIIVTAICWVIARRKEVQEKSRQRQLARARRA